MACTCLSILYVLALFCSTQVFHVPVEERRFNIDEPAFGNESRQSDIIRDIIERTGCDVEISQTKDHSLTIMVTGKPTCVLAARKAILSKLQTQVRGRR